LTIRPIISSVLCSIRVAVHESAETTIIDFFLLITKRVIYLPTSVYIKR